MTRLMLIAGWLVLTAGCATHDYQVQDDTLVLYLDKPDARQVTLFCSLDDFAPHEARRVGGRWAVSLPSGHPFRYYYVLDGVMFLPPCQMKESDDFGSANCIYDPRL
jgi:hypothetical protein